MERVRIEDHDPIRVLVLDRPDVRNAMDTLLLSELLDALADATADDQVRVLVLTGAGEAFSAGADLREELDHDATVRRMDLFGAVYEAVGLCPKPIVAAITGHCVGGGAEVATAADLRVADPSATFRFPGAALGFPVGPAKLVGLVGLGTAKDLVLTSRTITAVEAHRIGLVQRLAEPGMALADAVAVAASIAANNDDGVRFLKRMFLGFSGIGDRIAAENDALHAIAESGGDYRSVTMPNPKSRFQPGSWAPR